MRRHQRFAVAVLVACSAAFVLGGLVRADEAAAARKASRTITGTAKGIAFFMHPTPAAHAGDIKPGDDVVAVYTYYYNGLIVKGYSYFHFTCEVIELNSNQTKGLVKVTNITRYWNKTVREKDIRAMPFKDPRGYRTYNAPSSWGSRVDLGDTKWVSLSELTKK